MKHGILTEAVARGLRSYEVKNSNPDLYDAWEKTDQKSRDMWLDRADRFIEAMNEAGLFIGIDGKS